MEFAIDPGLALVGLIAGFIVGLTGMGGGALLTPALVLIFNVPPLTAVSSDIVASAFMKPLGGTVHYRQGTVNFPLVRWLVLGSVPASFGGVWLLTRFAGSSEIDSLVRLALGVALLLVAGTLALRQLTDMSRAARGRVEASAWTVRPGVTALIGVFGGLVVGVTSVGAGSLMMALLLMAYPKLRLRELVGTDLVQAVPLIASAATAHLIFGRFDLALSASIVVGALPGVFAGAKLSSKAPDHLIRPVLVAVLMASALKLLGASPRFMLFAGSLIVLGAIAGVLVGARRARGAISRLA